jgi:flagellar biosynthesis/type III secretory pathway protein FliH
VVLAIVGEALELARNKEQVVLYVNPAEVDLVQQNREELLQSLSPAATLHIIGDAGIERGGCRVETEDRKIEATLKERWEAVCEALEMQ